MDFQKYIHKFDKIPKVKTVNIIEDIFSPQIHFQKGNNILDRKKIKEFIEITQQKVLNLPINSIKFETVENIFLFFIESNIALILVLEKDIDLRDLKSHIDQFLNDLLIHM
jgi:hypothetical protein